MPEINNPTRVGHLAGGVWDGTQQVPIHVPPGSLPGDVMLAIFFIMDKFGGMELPAGWARVGTPIQTTFRRMEVYARALSSSDIAQGGFTFTQFSTNGVSWSTLSVRGSVAPDSLIAGPPWARVDTTVKEIRALSTPVPRTGDLVLGLMVENFISEYEVPVTGASQWFQHGHHPVVTGLKHTHLVTYIDQAPAGPTPNIVATYPYPEGQGSSEGAGFQVIFPGSDTPVPVTPTVDYAGTYGYGTTWLTMGAETNDVTGNVRVDARPVTGDAAVKVSPLGAPDARGWVSGRVDGLVPNTLYDLTMVDINMGVTLATVRATTTGGVRSSFKVVTGSCQKSNADAPIYNEMAAEGASFFVHQGDLHYADASTEAAWRDGVAGNLSKPAMKNLMSKMAMSYHWDNHDWGGSASWRESLPKNWAPQAIRNLMGRDTFVGEKGIYRTWTHNGVRFIDTDQWTLRDEAVTNPLTNATGGKTMLGVEQRNWLFNVLESATETVIIWFTSFPLYGNYIGNGRWGNFLDEAAIIESWLNAHPSVRDRTVAVGGDSHDIRADDGTNTMWRLPSLNASPLNRIGDSSTTSGPSPRWNIHHGAPTSSGAAGTIDVGVYSLLDFQWNAAGNEVTVIWQAKKTGGGVIATHTMQFTDEGIGTSPTTGIFRLLGGKEQPIYASRVYGGKETPVASVEVYDGTP